MLKLRPHKGAPALVLIWVLLWSVPPLRRQNERAVRGGLTYRDDVWSGLYPTEAQIESAFQNAPDDGFLAAQRLQNSPARHGNNPGDVARFFREYDALLARFPDRLDLRRARLMRATMGNIVPVKYTPPPAGTSAVPRSSPPYLSAAGLQKMAQAARAGAKLAPDDAFFPWMEAMALWGLGREDAAVGALERAGRCSTFNDGIGEEARQKIAFAESQRTLDWQEKLGGYYATLWPHLSRMRALTREVVYSGVTKYRAGDKSEAWRRWESALRATSAMRRAHGSGPDATLISLLSAEAMQLTVWRTVAQQVGGAPVAAPPVVSNAVSSRAQTEARLRREVKAFEALARRDGRAPLAAWSAREWSQIAARRADPRFAIDLNNFFNNSTRKWPWANARARWTLQVDWIGARAMVLAALGVLLWLSGGTFESLPRRHARVRVSRAHGAFWSLLWRGAVGGRGGRRKQRLSFSGGRK